MAAPFVPPTSTSPKPEVPKWVPPEPTKLVGDEDWAQLHTIELNLLDSPDPIVVENLVQTTKAAIKEDGFLYLTNYGVSLEQVCVTFAQEDLTYLRNSLATPSI